jgi:phenylacetate-coenzyme A ligase PaaK-like adenylate-forming protein
VVPRADASPPFWRHNRAERQLYMSAFHISPVNAPAYAAALNDFRPEYLVGYASSHFFLARMFKEMGIRVPAVRAILTSSEKLTDEMRSTLQEVYRGEVYDAYSGVEACCLFSECEEHSLHISPDVGIVEFVTEEGLPAPPGTPGEIVATGLLNPDQPLVRYRTGDLGILSPTGCACGRAMPVVKELIGRLEDTVIGPDGRETVRFHGIFIALPGVREGQVIQESLDRFTVKIVPSPADDASVDETIRERFATRLGRVSVTIERVDSIPRTDRGKFRAVISHVQRTKATR